MKNVDFLNLIVRVRCLHAKINRMKACVQNPGTGGLSLLNAGVLKNEPS